MPRPSCKRAAVMLFGLFAALIVALPAAASAAGTDTVSVYSSLTDLRPDKAPPAGASQEARISAARNETESFQLLVQAGASGDTGVSVEAGALSGPGGATLPASAMTVYRESYYQVTQRSNGEGEVGYWPDALIPAKDDFYGENRNAFPVEIAANGRLAVWVDVLVPVGQTPGGYSGSVVVKDASGVVASVPVALTVRSFVLPSTSTLKSAFFLSTSKVCAAMTGNSNCTSASQAWQLDALFAEAGLDNRISLANAYAGSPTSSYFSQYFLPLVQGTDSRVSLPGAKLTSVEAYGPSCGSCIGEWKKVAEADGFAGRFFDYVCDEPETSAEWEACRGNASSARQQWEGVHTLVTAPYNSSASSYINTFTPLINEIESSMSAQPSAYSSLIAQAPTKELWLYTSCRSYSCDGTEGSAFNGWPGYAIDAPPSHARAMGWLSFLYRSSGELYYSTTQSLTTATTNQYVSGGNGDGNLFYAGTPSGGNGSIAVGGSRPIPIESIRLKRIRDGREDYEYLHLLEERGGASEALEIVRELFGPESRAAQSGTVSSAALSSDRDRLAAAIGGEGVEPAESPVESPEGPEAPVEHVEAPVETHEAPERPATTPVSPQPTPVTPPVSPKSTPKHSSSSSTSTSPSKGGRSSGSRVHASLLRVSSPRSAVQLRNRGLRVLVRCDAACRVEVGSSLKPRAARRLGLQSTTIGTGSARLGAGETTWVTVTLTGSARSKLRAASSEPVGVQADLSADPV